MNVSVEHLGPCKKLVRVEVDAQTVDQAFETATTEFQRHVQLPGFRPGKVPRDRVAKQFAKDIAEEAKKQLISTAYRDAIKEQKFNPVGYPDIEEVQFGRGQALQFTATIEIAPDFELPEYKGLSVKAENRVVTSEDIDKALNVLREQRATYNDLDRASQMGDFLVLNYTCTCEGKPLVEVSPAAKSMAERTNFWLLLKEDVFLPGFPQQLVGVKKGDKKTVNLSFPADFPDKALTGKPAVFEVEVTGLKERILPPLDDTLAKAYGAENVDKLREGVNADLERELKHNQTMNIRNQLVRALLDKVTFELPESAVMAETRNMVYDIVRQNTDRGVAKEIIDEKKDEIFNNASAGAKERVKLAFLLQRIAEKEKITASQQEMMQRIVALARQYDIRPEKFIKQLQDRNALGEIAEQIVSAKVLDLLQLHAKTEEAPAAPAPAPQA